MTLWYTNRLFCLETVNKPGYFSFSISTTYCQRQVCIFIQPICHFFFSAWVWTKNNCVQKLDHIFMPNICAGVYQAFSFWVGVKTKPSRPRPVHLLNLLQHSFRILSHFAQWWTVVMIQNKTFKIWAPNQRTYCNKTQTKPTFIGSWGDSNSVSISRNLIISFLMMFFFAFQGGLEVYFFKDVMCTIL